MSGTPASDSSNSKCAYCTKGGCCRDDWRVKAFCERQFEGSSGTSKSYVDVVNECAKELESVYARWKYDSAQLTQLTAENIRIRGSNIDEVMKLKAELSTTRSLLKLEEDLLEQESALCQRLSNLLADEKAKSLWQHFKERFRKWILE